MREKILQAAEKRVRAAGFAEMSFRDVASDVGIKSASVHYHFPTKAELGEALVEEYTTRFNAFLVQLDTEALLPAIRSYIALYAKALILDEAICLCAIMGAEAIGLPREINEKTRTFFEMNLVWLENLFGKHLGASNRPLAAMVVSALEGAIIVSSASKDRKIFDDVAEEVIQLIASRA